MWFLSGAAAAVLTILNITQYLRRKQTKWFRFFALAMTAFTICCFYSQVSIWANAGDWAAIMDVVPFMAKALWVLAAASVVINGITLFENRSIK